VIGKKAKMFCIEAQTFGCKPRQWFPFRDIHLLGSCEKLKNELGITPKTSLFEGLKCTFEKTPKEILFEPILQSSIELELLKKLN